MSNTTTNQDLAERIERLVQEHISATRTAARAAIDRAFTSPARVSSAESTRQKLPLRSRQRRASEEVAALGQRLYEAVYAKPGQTITELRAIIGGSTLELQLPMAQLKRAGRVRSVGARSSTRYFPLAERAIAAAE